MYELLEKEWTFIVALHMSNKRSTSYLDIRAPVRLNRQDVTNMRLLAVSVYDRHTFEVIFDKTVRVLMSCLHCGRIPSSAFERTATEICLAMYVELQGSF